MKKIQKLVSFGVIQAGMVGTAQAEMADGEIRKINKNTGKITVKQEGSNYTVTEIKKAQ